MDFENGRISNFQQHMTLTLDLALWYTIMHHSSTSTYIPKFIQIGETFCGRTDGWTSIRTEMDHTSRPAILGGVDLIMLKYCRGSVFWDAR